MPYYITLGTMKNGAIKRTVIDAPRSLPRARRVARMLARDRFGSPEFVKDQTLAGGYWREAAQDGETKGDTITIEASTEDIH